MEKKFSVYLGNNTEATSAGFDIEGSFLCVVEVANEESDPEATLRKTLEELRTNIRSRQFSTLYEFGKNIQEFIAARPVRSFASLYLHNDTLYAVTYHAEIQLRRSGEWFVVAQGSQQSSGTIHKEDVLFLSTTALSNLFSPSQIPENLNEPKSIIEFVNDAIGDKKNVPAAGLVVMPEPKEEPVVIPDYNTREKPREFGSDIQLPRERFSLPKFIKRIRIPLFLLIVGIIGWKMISEVTRVVQAQREKTFTKQISSIVPSVQKLQESALSDTGSAQKVTSLRSALTKLLKDYPDRKNQIQPLLDQLTRMEKTLGDTHMSTESLFFDLRLIDQKAKATSMALSTDTICILDMPLGKAYVITISSKKQDSYSVPDPKNSRLIGCTNDAVYVFNDTKGVYQLNASGAKNIVPHDKQWGSIYQMQLFNSNIYLLDGIKDEIFKYIPIENGYSDALSYFQPGNSMKLKTARSFVIDYSVYILTGSGIYKYTGGIKDTFSLKTASLVSNITELYKDSESDYLYALSNPESRIVAIDKNGEIKKSIFNPKLKTVQYFGVNKDSKILFLNGNSIYVLDNF